MGNKARAKEIMRAAGVPCVPGYQGSDQSESTMLAEADKIGFPVMIKAVAGGGGRGMRLVPDAAAFASSLRSARSEAQGAFGDPTMILERAIVDPRHIEIQVFGDCFGHAIHLGERDCSVQRRHQKLIEEAPSPAVSPDLRARMGAVAVAAVKALGYEGAGTLEFLLDPSGEFYFMEMNTRLQVEHPVTEAITGLDLVELQLRVAHGEPLGLQQDDIRFSGHAIEVRLCAEDATRDFMPQAGRLALWQIPDGVRVEHALESGVGDFAILRFNDRQDHRLWCDPRAGEEQVDLQPRADRGLRPDHQSGVPDVVLAASCLCQGRCDHCLCREVSRDIAAAAQADVIGRRARRVVAIRHQSPRAAVARRTNAGRDISDSRAYRNRQYHP